MARRLVQQLVAGPAFKDRSTMETVERMLPLYSNLVETACRPLHEEIVRTLKNRPPTDPLYSAQSGVTERLVIFQPL